MNQDTLNHLRAFAVFIGSDAPSNKAVWVGQRETIGVDPKKAIEEYRAHVLREPDADPTPHAVSLVVDDVKAATLRITKAREPLRDVLFESMGDRSALRAAVCKALELLQCDGQHAVCGDCINCDGTKNRHIKDGAFRVGWFVRHRGARTPSTLVEGVKPVRIRAVIYSLGLICLEGEDAWRLASDFENAEPPQVKL